MKSSMLYIYNILFFLLILFMPIDDFPLGKSLLREFGVRPVNFILLIFFLIYFLYLFQKKNIIKEKFVISILFLILIVPINYIILIILDIANVVNGKPIFLQWFFQTLMMLWGFISIFLWIFLSKKMIKIKFFEKKTLSYILIVQLIFFYLHYFQFEWFYPILSFFQSKIDIFRGSGFSSEPSLWSSYLLLIVPLMLINVKNKKFILLIVFLSVTSGFLSESRSYMLIFLLQILISLFLFPTKKNHIFQFLSIGSVAVVLIFSIYFEDIISVFNIEESLSSLMRLGSTYTSILIILDHPFGIGNGMFTAYYPTYAPDFLLKSEEALKLINGEATFRASTYNLFTRIGAEYGLIFLILSLIFYINVNIQFLQHIKMATINKKNIILVYLSFIGGTSFFFQQDQYGYQPGLFIIGFSLVYLQHFRRSLL